MNGVVGLKVGRDTGLRKEEFWVSAGVDVGIGIGDGIGDGVSVGLGV